MSYFRVSVIHVNESEKAWSTQIVGESGFILCCYHRGLLVWHSASTHRAKDMKIFLADNKIDRMMIPAAMTGYPQTLDIAINKAFKDPLRMEMNEYILKTEC